MAGPWKVSFILDLPISIDIHQHWGAPRGKACCTFNAMC